MWFPLMLALITRGVNGCARTSPGGGGASPTTTTPTPDCANMNGAALLAGTFTVGSTFFGDVSPVSTCTTCKAGNAAYYPDSGDAVPTASEQKAIGGLTCANMCVCEADGTCFQRSGSNVNVVLYPFCSGGSCSVYAVIVSQSDTAGLVPVGGGSTITASSQIDPTTLDRLPVTSGDNIYPKITYASCSGCQAQTTC